MAFFDGQKGPGAWGMGINLESHIMTPESRNHKTAVLELDKPDASWHLALNASFPELPFLTGHCAQHTPHLIFTTTLEGGYTHLHFNRRKFEVQGWK